MSTNVAGIPGQFNRDAGEDVRMPHAERIRRIIGSAHVAIAASGEKVRAALKVHHSTVSHRKAGISPFASAAIEADLLERAGICTNPLLDAIKKVVLAARAKARGGVVSICDYWRTEADADAREDICAADFHAGVPGARERWIESLLEQARESEALAEALLVMKDPARR